MTDEVNNETPRAPQGVSLESMTHEQLVAHARGLEATVTDARRVGTCDVIQIDKLAGGIGTLSEQKTRDFHDYQQLDHNARFLLSFVEPLTKALLHEVDTAPTTACLQPCGDFYPNTKRAQRGRKGWVALGEAKQMRAFAERFGVFVRSLRRTIDDFKSGKLKATAEDVKVRKWEELNAK